MKTALIFGSSGLIGNELFKTILLNNSYDKIKVGSCVHSEVTVFSFHPVKIITTAEGGMAMTNNKELADSVSYTHLTLPTNREV